MTFYLKVVLVCGAFAAVFACDKADGGDGSGGAEHPACEVDDPWGTAWVEIVTVPDDMGDMPDDHLEMTITAWSESGFALESPELSIDAAVPRVDGYGIDAPQVGETVVASVWKCASGEREVYVTVEDREGSLWWEGGKAACAGPEERHLRYTAEPSGDPCVLPNGDIYTPMAVEVTGDETVILGVGEARQVSIGGDVYVAYAPVTMELSCEDCADGHGPHASAYLVRLE